jgi:hypothetical protein
MPGGRPGLKRTPAAQARAVLAAAGAFHALRAALAFDGDVFLPPAWLRQEGQEETSEWPQVGHFSSGIFVLDAGPTHPG